MHIGHGHDEDEHEYKHEEEEKEEDMIKPEYGVDANDVGDGHEEKDEEEEEGSAVHRLLHQHHPGPAPKTDWNEIYKLYILNYSKSEHLMLII